MTIKETKQRLCSVCILAKERRWVSPVGVDEENHVIYKEHNTKCQLRPVTEDGKDCPYFKNHFIEESR